MISRVCALLRMRPPVVDNTGLLYVSGATVPEDDTLGYQTGCIFQHTDGGGGTALYVNEGDSDACDFNAIDAGAIDVSLDVGVFSSLTAGDGIALSSTDRSAVAIYGDDGGDSIVSNVYNLRTRLLLTVDQAGSSIRALMAQLKLLDGVDVATGVYTANQGYLELAGDTDAQAGATLSCFDASLEVASTKTLTVDADGVVAGIRIETTGAGTITNNGVCTAILVANPTGAPNWPVGLYIAGPDVITGVRVGDFVAAASTAGGVQFGTDMDVYSDGQLDVMQVHGATDSLITGSYSAKCGRFRHVVQVVGTLEAEAYGLVGQVVAKTVVFGLYAAGLMGTIESNGGFHAGDGASTSYPCMAGVIARPGGSGITVDNGSVLAGFAALSNTNTSVTLTGTALYPAVYVNRTGATSIVWSHGLYIDGLSVSCGIQMGVQDTGISLTTAYPYAVEVHCEANADIAAASSSAGIYSRFAIETAQTTQLNHIAVFAKLRPKANLGDGNHVAVYALVESSAGVISGDGDTLTAAGIFALDMTSVNITTGHLNGICIDSSVANTGTMNATMAGLRIKKSGANRPWPTAITVESTAATKLFTGTAAMTGASAADAFTITATDALTAGSGYTKGLCVAMNSTGTKTGSANVNAIAADHVITGAIPACASAIAVYSIVNAAVAVGHQIGLEVYIDDCHSSATVNTQSALYLGIDNGEDQPTRSDFIYCKTHGGTADSLIYMSSCQCDNLVEMDGTMTTSPFTGTGGSDANVWLRVKCAGTTYKIKLYADS